jgi:hypothetical protein
LVPAIVRVRQDSLPHVAETLVHLERKQAVRVRLDVGHLRSRLRRFSQGEHERRIRGPVAFGQIRFAMRDEPDVDEIVTIDVPAPTPPLSTVRLVNCGGRIRG